MDCYLKYACNKESCPTRCMKYGKTDALLTNAVLTSYQKRYVQLDNGDGSDEQAYNTLSFICNNIYSFVKHGKNLYLYSEKCGNGKTTWSIKMIQSYINKLWMVSDMDSCPALFINVPRFLLALKDSISEQNDYVDYIKAHVLNADLVVWDEIGVKTFTPYEHEHLLNLINTRLDMGKSNVYTSNVSGDILKEKVGERLYSRIVRLSEPIEFVGNDRRNKGW